MFLDEELENIYKVKGEKLSPLLSMMLNRLPNPEGCSVTEFINTIKQIDGSWRLFCKRHSFFSPDFFKKYILSCDTEGKIKIVLGW